MFTTPSTSASHAPSQSPCTNAIPTLMAVWMEVINTDIAVSITAATPSHIAAAASLMESPYSVQNAITVSKNPSIIPLIVSTAAAVFPCMSPQFSDHAVASSAMPNATATSGALIPPIAIPIGANTPTMPPIPKNAATTGAIAAVTAPIAVVIATNAMPTPANTNINFVSAG